MFEILLQQIMIKITEGKAPPHLLTKNFFLLNEDKYG
jgi:hypothetical protein